MIRIKHNEHGVFEAVDETLRTQRITGKNVLIFHFYVGNILTFSVPDCLRHIV